MSRNWRGIDKDTLHKLIVNGVNATRKPEEPATSREVLKSWGYGVDETIAIPTIVIDDKGNIGGAKWTVVGNITKRVSMKTTKIWPTEDVGDFYLSMDIPELDIFTFGEHGWNVSEWMDSSELSWDVRRKEGKGQETVSTSTFYKKGFSIRICVLPVSFNTVHLTMAILPLAKKDIKTTFPTLHDKANCPQLALAWGEKNVKVKQEIKLGIREGDGRHEMDILPIIQDTRTYYHSFENFPPSAEILKAMQDFLSECQGLNNKSPETLQKALAGLPYREKPMKPKFLWPAAFTEENEFALTETGMHNVLVT